MAPSTTDDGQAMALRDYFAAKALPVLLIVPTGSPVAPVEAVAAAAYDIADAMLKERDKST